MHNFMRDMRVCFRQLRKAPGFALTTILTLGLGIGATTAIFSLVNTVLLKPLPFQQQEKLAWVTSWDSRFGRAEAMSYPDFLDYRSQQKSFSAFASYHSGTHTLTGRGEARHLEGQVVSSDFFHVLGVKPVLGRDLSPEDENASNRSIMLSHSLWESAFKGDPDIVGKPITLDGLAYSVVGVMPAGFSFPVQQPAPQFWSSVAEDAYDPDGKGEPMTVERGAHFLDGIGRLKNGVSFAQAQADVTSIAAALSVRYPKTNKRFNGAHVEPELDHVVGDSRFALRMLFAAVSLVLLIACANVAGLTLARASRRRSEMAVRTAIGASRKQIVEQVLTESVLLSIAGGCFGLLLAMTILRGFVHLLPQNLPRLDQISIDLRVLLFALLVSIGTGILFGVFPAWRMSRVNPSLAMREGSHSVTSDRKQHGLHSALVIAETALGLVLLVGSGLLIRSFVHMLHINPGFEPTNVLTARIDLPYTDLNKFTHFYDDLQSRMAAQPGVEGVGAAFALPFWSDGIRITF
ncbi:MAG TPA: ABC transporter permease, partial [Terriglobales bacterium]